MPRKTRLDPALPVLLALTLLLFLALWARLAGTDWDQGAGLHPDERHMLFVSQDMARALDEPAHAGLGLSGWLAEASPLNPHLGGRSHVYGDLPVLVVTFAARATGQTGWFEMMHLGRQISAILDGLTILAVFLAARLLAGDHRALLAAALYAAMPSALQLANFFTVEAWLSAATAWALVPMAALATGRGGLRSAAMAGIFTGLALACKITGGALALPGLAALVLARRHGMGWGRIGLCLLAALAVTLITFRLANPFAFAGIFTVSQHWIADFQDLGAVVLDWGFPPNWQWLAGYGPLPFLRDFALFGCGPVVTALILTLPAARLWRAATLPLAAALAFVLPPLVSPIAVLRYAAPALPALALAAALAPDALLRRGRAALPLLLALWWGAGAWRLHDGQHPRVTASLWLWTLPAGTTLLNETGWDEALPVIVAVAPGENRRWPDQDGHFILKTLEMVAPDSSAKADAMAALMAESDFLILSSDRQSGVMPRLPDRFPLTTAHYAALFSGQACFAPALAIDRGFPLPFLPFDDSWTQEPWRIYDHPKVRIYRREACFDAAAYAEKLKAALP